MNIVVDENIPRLTVEALRAAGPADWKSLTVVVRDAVHSVYLYSPQ